MKHLKQLVGCPRWWFPYKEIFQPRYFNHFWWLSYKQSASGSLHVWFEFVGVESRCDSFCFVEILETEILVEVNRRLVRTCRTLCVSLAIEPTILSKRTVDFPADKLTALRVLLSKRSTGVTRFGMTCFSWLAWPGRICTWCRLSCACVSVWRGLNHSDNQRIVYLELHPCNDGLDSKRKKNERLVMAQICLFLTARSSLQWCSESDNAVPCFSCDVLSI